MTRVFSTRLTIATQKPTEFRDVTADVRDALQARRLGAGLVLVSALHASCALLLGEFQAALVSDLDRVLQGLAPPRGGYRHDAMRASDCEGGNASAHLRSVLLGSSIAVALRDGRPVLGRFQSIILAEFDGPRPRQLALHALGAP